MIINKSQNTERWNILYANLYKCEVRKLQLACEFIQKLRMKGKESVHFHSIKKYVAYENMKHISHFFLHNY